MLPEASTLVRFPDGVQCQLHRTTAGTSRSLRTLAWVGILYTLVHALLSVLCLLRPTAVAPRIRRIAIEDLLLRHGLSPSTACCEDPLQRVRTPSRSTPPPLRISKKHVLWTSEVSLRSTLTIRRQRACSTSRQQSTSPHCRHRTRRTERECSRHNPARHGDVHNLFDDALLHSLLWNNFDRVHGLFLDPFDNLNFGNLLLVLSHQTSRCASETKPFE